jgi:hypothetical protein
LTSSSFSTGPDQVVRGAITFQTPWLPLSPVVGAPYYGESTSEHVQTLANGAHITRIGQYKRTWRDAQGRTRTEGPMAMGRPASPDVPTVIQISDPVAGYMYVLDPEKKVVHRVVAAPGWSQSANSVRVANGPTPPAGAGGSASTRSVATAQPAERKSAAERPQTIHEALGTRAIDGVVVEGSRTTAVYPIGSANNDAPFSVTTESWRSPDLNLMILMTNDDPRTGAITSRIVNLNTLEPDPSLFVLPADYTIVDETSSFTITWKVQ